MKALTSVYQNTTKQDKKNIRIMKDVKKKEQLMTLAHNEKAKYIETKKTIESGVLKGENLEFAKKFAKMCKESAIKFYEEAQEIK